MYAYDADNFTFSTYADDFESYMETLLPAASERLKTDARVSRACDVDTLHIDVQVFMGPLDNDSRVSGDDTKVLSGFAQRQQRQELIQKTNNQIDTVRE